MHKLKFPNEPFLPLTDAGTSLDDYPMALVSHAEATKFCETLTKQEHAAGRLLKDWAYRLPTEAQWEYSCRAGVSEETLADEESAPPKHLEQAGSSLANGWGLCEMRSNVQEWCRDFYTAELPGGTDPEVVRTDPFRVVRGASNTTDPDSRRPDCRFRCKPEFRGDSVGFRVAVVRLKG